MNGERKTASLVKSNKFDELPTCPLVLALAASDGRVETVSLLQKPVQSTSPTSQRLTAPHVLSLAASRRPSLFLSPSRPGARPPRATEQRTVGMSAPPGASPQNVASSVTFPVATVGVAGMTAERIADYTQLQAGYRAGRLGVLELAMLKVYVMTLHCEVAVHHRELERQLEAAFQAASAAPPLQPAASAAALAPAISPATSGDAAKPSSSPPRARAFATSPMRMSDTTISSRRSTVPDRSRQTTTKHSSSTSTC